MSSSLQAMLTSQQLNTLLCVCGKTNTQLLSYDTTFNFVVLHVGVAISQSVFPRESCYSGDYLHVAWKQAEEYTQEVCCGTGRESSCIK